MSWPASLVAPGPSECRLRGSLDFVSRGLLRSELLGRQRRAALVVEAYIVATPPNCQPDSATYLNFLRHRPKNPDRPSVTPTNPTPQSTPHPPANPEKPRAPTRQNPAPTAPIPRHRRRSRRNRPPQHQTSAARQRPENLPSLAKASARPRKARIHQAGPRPNRAVGRNDKPSSPSALKDSAKSGTAGGFPHRNRRRGTPLYIE